MIRCSGLALCALLATLVLSACSTQLPLPEQGQPLQDVELPMQLHLRYQDAELQRDAIVVIQREAKTLRFSLFDALGVPQARQIFNDGGWYADGLLPPNPQARQWFAGLLLALTTDEHLQQQYPSATVTAQQRTLANGWQVLSFAPKRWQIIFNPQQTLQVEQMEWQP